MSSNQTDHAWTHEQMAAAVTKGLSSEEQSRFDAHLAACEPCVAEYAALRDDERRLAELFADARPPSGFEDRLIRSLRETKSSRFALARPLVHPMVRRAATGVAAALLLASAGYVVTSASNDGKRLDITALTNRPQSAPSLSDRSATGKPSTRPWGVAAGRSAGAQFAYDFDGGGAHDWSRNAGGYGIASEPAVGRDINGRHNALAGRESASLGTSLHWDYGHVSSRGFAGEPVATTDGARDGQQGGTALTEARDGQDGTVKPSDFRAVEVKDQPAGGAKIERSDPKPYFETLGGVVAAPPTKWFKPGEVAKGKHDVAGKEIQDLKQLAKKPTAGTTVEMGEEVTNSAPNFALTAGQPNSGGTPGREKGVQSLFAGAVVAANDAQETRPPQRAPQTQAASRKVIRTGAMEFEVDRFDAALAQITKLAQENDGYVGTTDSEKLPNGKVKGSVVVRVPPERLDTLVLQLRGIGDLRSQKMDAQDVTKQYTDLEGELRAARAMEERLLEIIKTGKGEIKDLLAAEKELGVWRTKIEKMVGEMRYYDNLVSLTTLTITAFERDIRTAAAAKETETVDAGIETEDVESARAAALKAIEEAKGRVIQSDVKRHDAGQFAAQVVAEVPADGAGPLIDRLKQLGKVARFEVQRRQTTPEGTQPAPGARLERAETRINLSLYNLANVAPRQTTNLNIAAADVEAAHRAIVARVEKAGGRVVTSNLSRPQAEQVVGAINFEVRSAEAAAVLGDVRGTGEVMRLTVTENPDTNNVTVAKQGVVVQLVSLATVPVRESTNIQLAAAEVPAAYNALRDAVRGANARVTTSQLNEAQRQNVTAILDFEVMRDQVPAVDEAIRKLGDVTQRTSGRSGDTENTVDSKVRIQVSFVDADQLPPRETTALGVEVSDPDKALAGLQADAQSAGGRVLQSNLSQERGGQTIGKLVVDVPLAKSVELITRAKGLGSVRMVQSTKDANAADGALALARLDLTLATADSIVSPDEGVWASIRRGLATSMTGLMWSLQLIVIGLCFVGPWVLLLVGGWKLLRRRKSGTQPATA